MARMPKIAEQENGWTKWIRPKMKLYRFGCCDCGLVHNLQFKIVGKGVEFRAQRNNRSTAALRRKSKKK